MVTNNRPDTILNFWFGDPHQPKSGYGLYRKVWFQKDTAFDQRIREQFWVDYEQARQGHYNHWQQGPRTCLALIILLDQVSRNLFRRQAQSFATDAQALRMAQYALAQTYDQVLLPVERFFLYLPFEHSENLDHQNQAVALFSELAAVAPELKDGLTYAQRHHQVIAQFGRFPHRNEILGRPNTRAETAFLQQPGSRF